MRRLDNIDLRLLRVFAALAESGSFSAAQISLNLSQPTLSTHIAALERALGNKLCLRGRGGFRLTPFGEATLAAARQLFADIDQFQRRLGQSTGQLAGRLNVGIVDGVVTCPQLGLQGSIHRLTSAASDIYIDLTLGTPQELELWITEGQRDIVIGPFAKQGPGVVYVPLFREPHALYCGAAHDLFDARPDQLDDAAIEKSLFSVRGFRQLEDLYRVDHPRASASVMHMEAQVMLILSGNYIGFLPCHIAASYIASGQMRTLKPQKYQFLSQHYVAFRRADIDRPLIKTFLREVQTQANLS